MPNPIDMVPVGESEILITWDDEHRSLYRAYALRSSCPCAQCVDENTGELLLDPRKIPIDIKVLQTIPIGRYAMRFNFNDGHNTGLYSFELLRNLCPCDGCRSRKQ